MRPPEFTGGNTVAVAGNVVTVTGGFNEAAGIHRRKQSGNGVSVTRSTISFNEAAGIHRRKRMVAPLDFTIFHECFNEAAGIHRRKRRRRHNGLKNPFQASMRPPEFTGGNQPPAGSTCGRTRRGFNEAAGIHRRKPQLRVHNDVVHATLQ